MNDRHTPETDTNVEDIGMGCHMVGADFSRRLERERDEAREAIKNAIKWFEWCLKVMNPPFDFDAFVSASEACKKLKREAAK
jgi:hypothetical protein